MAVIATLWGLFAGSQPTTTFAVSRTAQNQVVDTSFFKFKTIEEALGLPPAYTVKEYSIIFSSKGEIFKSSYTWQSDKLQWWMNRAKKGDKLTIDGIIVEKDGIRKKLMPKTFTF